MVNIAMSHKGRFKPIDVSKYRGDPTSVWYRSGWERRVMAHLDSSPSVVEWSSEEVVVPYVSPIDGRYHRYFPDFLVKTLDRATGKTTTRLVEVKPLKETTPPIVRKDGARITRKYLTEVATYAKNQAKWEAAQEYCADRGWEFCIWTEREIFGRDP